MSSSVSSLLLFSTLVMLPALAYGDNNCGLFDCGSGEWCCESFGTLLPFCSPDGWIDNTCVIYLYPNAIGLSRAALICLSLAILVVFFACITCCCCCCCGACCGACCGNWRGNRNSGRPAPAAPTTMVISNQPGMHVPQAVYNPPMYMQTSPGFVNQGCYDDAPVYTSYNTKDTKPLL